MKKIRAVSLIAFALIILLAPCPDAVSEVPREAEAMMGRAHDLLRGGDNSGALSKAQQARRIAPDCPELQASVGVMYQLCGNGELALEQYERVQSISLLREGAPDSRLTREIAEGEALMVYLANRDRIRHGLRPLRPHADLAIVARRHSREMRDLGYFAHDSPRMQHRRPSDRFANLFGQPPVVIGENLARMYSRPLWSFNLDNVHESHVRLMESEGHRNNILWDKPLHIGVGIAVNERGDYWITENFSTI